MSRTVPRFFSDALQKVPVLFVLAAVLAVLAAVLDRVGIFQLAAVAVMPGGDWPSGIARSVAALSASVVMCLGFERIGLHVADRELNRAVLLAGPDGRGDAAWDVIAGPRQAALLDAVRTVEDGTQRVISAIPSAMITILTMGWLALHNMLSLIVIAACCVVVSAMARPRLLRQGAGQTVVERAEDRIDRLVSRLVAAGEMLRVGVGVRRDFVERAVWPPLDDSARATSSYLQSNAWISGLGDWLELLIVGVLILIAPAANQEWMVSVVLVVASLRPARKALSALPAITSLQSGMTELARLADGVPEPTQKPPPRWQILSLRHVQVARRDGRSATLNAIGPLDLDLRSGEIVVVTGADRVDCATFFHLLAGRVTAEAGEVRIDGHLIAASTLRGMCGGVMQGAVTSPAIADTPRARLLLERFDLAATASTQTNADDPLSQAEQTRSAFVAAELEGRSVRLYDMRLLRPQPEFLGAYLETFREAKEHGALCVIASDDPALLRIADRVLRLQDGQLWAGTVEAAP